MISHLLRILLQYEFGIFYVRARVGAEAYRVQILDAEGTALWQSACTEANQRGWKGHP